MNRLVKAAVDAVVIIYENTTVQPEETLDMLMQVRDEIDCRITCLRDDLGKSTR